MVVGHKCIMCGYEEPTTDNLVISYHWRMLAVGDTAIRIEVCDSCYFNKIKPHEKETVVEPFLRDSNGGIS